MQRQKGVMAHGLGHKIWDPGLTSNLGTSSLGTHREGDLKILTKTFFSAECPHIVRYLDQGFQNTKKSCNVFNNSYFISTCHLWFNINIFKFQRQFSIIIIFTH